jgi:nitrogen fixation/metabolism regulation signal transduction histidine kinase
MILKTNPLNAKSLKTERKVKKTQSLEHQLKFFLVTSFVVFFMLALWIMSLLSLTILMKFTVLTVVFAPLSIILWRFYQKIITPFYSLTNLVEAVRLEDYSLRLKDHYQSGILHTLSQEISRLADDLQQRKQAYDQHTLLVYHLIEQLETPIAIFNDQLQLSHANGAFSNYIEQPWQTKRLTLSEKLGLVYQDGWSFKDQSESKRWQIKHSQFVEHDQTYHLVILTNVEQLLRVNQQKSWQQIIRVLGHEIHNSLTPIKSLAQTLASLETTESKSKEILQVIVDRSISLQEFVNRYGDISKNVVINKTWFNSSELVETITALFPESNIVVDNKVKQIFADAVLLKQVLINLVKNAIEASREDNTPYIELTLSPQIKRSEESVVIQVTDNGQGIANTDNLFVPFYTTKKQGQGVGLSFSQNIIEQHDGRLTLMNNDNKQGATATIYLSLLDSEN